MVSTYECFVCFGNMHARDHFPNFLGCNLPMTGVTSIPFNPKSYTDETIYNNDANISRVSLMLVHRLMKFNIFIM